MSVAFSCGAAAGAAPFWAPRTSAFMIRPPGPLPWTRDTSMPSAWATRRATGEMRTPSGRTSSGSSTSSSAALGTGSGTAAGFAPLPPDFIRAMTWPTVTVSPGSARISSITPEAGAGTSASTLSVLISTMVSSASTASPGCLAHSRITPSETDSPIAGMMMSTASPSGSSTGARSGAAPFVAISASTAPTWTVSPSAACSLTTVPVAGAGTSASTLSVEISTSVSSSETSSPSCLRHSRMVPSETESPIAGMTTSTVVSIAIQVPQDTFSTTRRGVLDRSRILRSSR